MYAHMRVYIRTAASVDTNSLTVRELLDLLQRMTITLTFEN